MTYNTHKHIHVFISFHKSKMSYNSSISNCRSYNLSCLYYKLSCLYYKLTYKSTGRKSTKYWALFGLLEVLLCLGREWQNSQVGLLGGAPLGPHKFPFGCPVLPLGTILCACWGRSGANDLGDVLGPSGAAEANQKQTAVH